MFIDNVVKEARRECIREVTLSTGMIGTLLFADDMVMMAETREALQHNVEAMNAALTRWGLKVNWEKSKVMRVVRKGEECQVLVITWPRGRWLIYHTRARSARGR